MTAKQSELPENEGENEEEEQEEQQDGLSKGTSLDDVAEEEIASVQQEELEAEQEEGSEEGSEEGEGEEENPEDPDGEESEEGSEEEEEDPPQKPEPEEEEPEEEETPKEVEERLSRIEELEKDLDIPDDINFDTSAELLKYQQEMHSKQDELKDLKTKQAEYEAEQEQSKTRTESAKQWDREFGELEKDGTLPAVKDENDENDPGVKERAKIFQWMIDHNDNASHPNEQIFSVKVAHRAMRAEEAEAELKQQQEDKKKAESDLRKKRGGMVGNGGQTNSSPGAKGTPEVSKGMTMDDVLEAELNRYK